jgi:hypothetical protein
VLDIIWSGRLAVTNAALPDFDFYAGAILPHLVTVSTDHFEMATKSSICSDESAEKLKSLQMSSDTRSTYLKIHDQQVMATPLQGPDVRPVLSVMLRLRRNIFIVGDAPFKA